MSTPPEITGPIVVGGAWHCDTPGCGAMGVVTTLKTAMEMLAMADVHAKTRRHWVQAQVSWYTEEGPDPRS